MTKILFSMLNSVAAAFAMIVFGLWFQDIFFCMTCLIALGCYMVYGNTLKLYPKNTIDNLIGKFQH